MDNRNRKWMASALFFVCIDVWALSLEPVISSNLESPTFVASPPNDDRLFVSERDGAIKVFDNAGNFLSTFLTLSDVNTIQEGGLLGFAFHPGYSENGFIFVSYTVRIADRFFSRIERYTTSTTNPNLVSNTPPKLIISVNQPQPNHNAGWIGFSPTDGYLYIPMGDGGNSHDFFGNGQNINTLLGSILRIDIDTPISVPYKNPIDNPFVDRPGLDEIWAYGVRNPWRAGFDRDTGVFYFGDVGERSWEEINRGEKEGNFGWPLREGFVETPTGTVGGPLSPRIDPIHVYPNPEVGQSVVGGVVYRGPVLALQGQYLFAEFFTGDIWQMNPDGSNVTPLSDSLSYSGTPVAFGEDNDGDVYLVDFGGTVYRFEGEVAPPATVSIPAAPALLIGIWAAIMLLLSVNCANKPRREINH